MRFLLLLPLLVTACTNLNTQVISDTPKYNRGDYYQNRGNGHSRVPTIRRSEKQEPPKQQEWEPFEDRYISTHPFELSVETLTHRTPEEIRERMKYLEKQ